MRLEDLEAVALIKEKLEQQQLRLQLINHPRMSFKVEVKQARGSYTLLSQPHSSSDKERNSFTSTSIDLITAAIRQEAIARIQFYTKQLETEYGIKVAQTHIRAA